MQETQTRPNGHRINAPLTASIAELAGPMPDVAVAPTTGNAPRRRRSVNPRSIFASITRDAAKSVDGDVTLLSAAPVEPGDPLLLFLVADNRVQVTVAVQPEVVRSQRLRNGTEPPPGIDVELLFEVLRAVDVDSIPDSDARSEDAVA